MIKQLLAFFQKKQHKHSPHVEWLRYCKENPEAPGCRIYYEATEKDWEDFFAVQEDLDTLFDR